MDTLVEDGHNGDDNRTDNIGVHEEEDMGELITKKVYTQHQYWNYVDDYLNLIRLDFAHIMDHAERHCNGHYNHTPDLGSDEGVA